MELGPALRAVQVRSWDDVHDVCASLGVVLRPHGNGLVFEDVEQRVRVMASLPVAPRSATPARFDFEPEFPRPWRTARARVDSGACYALSARTSANFALLRP